MAAGAGLGALAVVSGLATLVTGVLALALSWGFWTLKPWAWILGVALAIIQIVLFVLSLVGGGGFYGILPAALAVVIIYYLMRPEIQALFGRK